MQSKLILRIDFGSLQKKYFLLKLCEQEIIYLLKMVKGVMPFVKSKEYSQRLHRESEFHVNRTRCELFHLFHLLIEGTKQTWRWDRCCDDR